MLCKGTWLITLSLEYRLPHQKLLITLYSNTEQELLFLFNLPALKQFISVSWEIFTGWLLSPYASAGLGSFTVWCGCSLFGCYCTMTSIITHQTTMTNIIQIFEFKIMSRLQGTKTCRCKYRVSGPCSPLWVSLVFASNCGLNDKSWLYVSSIFAPLWSQKSTGELKCKRVHGTDFWRSDCPSLQL